MTPVDLWWAHGEYLSSPDDRPPRVIDGLSAFATDLLSCGASVIWDDATDGKLAQTDVMNATVHLSPALFTRPPTTIRDALGHETSHLVVGRSCQRARHWQRLIYRETLDRD